MAPLTLNRSVIVVFIDALRFICSRVIACSRRPTLFAGRMKIGSTSSAIRVRRHSRASIATRVNARVMTFDTTVPSVPVTAFCAPITSLFSRLISAPVCVRVKNAMGWRCTRSNSADRSS